jgi:hypothetical protein
MKQRKKKTLLITGSFITDSFGIIFKLLDNDK